MEVSGQPHNLATLLREITLQELQEQGGHSGKEKILPLQKIKLWLSSL
jgi:hypothetical protein